jgi:hypothetical protein
VRTFTDIEKLVGVATKLERVLGELGETPYEPLKEEQEDGASETIMEKQIITLNNTLINFFKGIVHKSKGIIFFHYVWRMPNLQRKGPFGNHLSEIE